MSGGVTGCQSEFPERTSLVTSYVSRRYPSGNSSYVGGINEQRPGSERSSWSRAFPFFPPRLQVVVYSGSRHSLSDSGIRNETLNPSYFSWKFGQKMLTGQTRANFLCGTFLDCDKLWSYHWYVVCICFRVKCIGQIKFLPWSAQLWLQGWLRCCRKPSQLHLENNFSRILDSLH